MSIYTTLIPAALDCFLLVGLPGCNGDLLCQGMQVSLGSKEFLAFLIELVVPDHVPRTRPGEYSDRQADTYCLHYYGPAQCCCR